MQELLLGPLLTRWGPLGLAYVKQNPWQVFAVAVVTLLLLHMLFSYKKSGTGDFPELGGIGGGDGDGGGD